MFQRKFKISSLLALVSAASLSGASALAVPPIALVRYTPSPMANAVGSSLPYDVSAVLRQAGAMSQMPTATNGPLQFPTFQMPAAGTSRNNWNPNGGQLPGAFVAPWVSGQTDFDPTFRITPEFAQQYPGIMNARVPGLAVSDVPFGEKMRWLSGFDSDTHEPIYDLHLPGSVRYGTPLFGGAAPSGAAELPVGATQAL